MAMKVAVIESTSSGVNHHRLTNPLSYLEGHEVTTYNTIPLDKVDEVEADVLIFSRYLYEEEQTKILARFKSRGTKIIVDIDDHWTLPQNHPAYLNYKIHEVPRKSVECLQWADVIWTTHSKLAEAAKKAGATRVQVYPNALDPTDEQWKPNPVESEKLRVGFVGGVTHEHDLYETADAFRLLHDTRKDVESIVCGYNTEALRCNSSASPLRPCRRSTSPR